MKRESISPRCAHRSDSKPGAASRAVKDLASPPERRRVLLDRADRGADALSFCEAALEDPDMVVRRTAFRLLVDAGPPARSSLRRAARSHDPSLRRMALFALDMFGETEAADLQTALRDQEDMVRAEAVRIASRMAPRPAWVESLLKTASADRAHVVRAEALRGVFGEVQGRSVRGEHMDRYIDVGQVLPLPSDGWALRLDRDGLGHTRGWFEEALDDRDWDVTRIETPWEAGYLGVGWYRRRFTLPAESAWDGVELHFEGVSESAWVWVNGKYAGEHDKGGGGSNDSFSMDSTDLVRWGGVNQVTVRVMNAQQDGGILKPVAIHFLQVR